MTNTLLADLYTHMEWADAAVWKAVFAQGGEDSKLRDYLAHLHMAQRAFLRAWRGEPRDAEYPRFENAAAILAWARPNYAEARRHLASLSEAQLTEPLIVPWADLLEKRLGRRPGPTTVADTALQVALHTTYHRGQVNARLRALGGEPPLVDYIAWIWFGKPAPEWP